MSLSIHDELMELTKYLPCRCIDVDNNPYLQRYFLGSAPSGDQKWLHRFIAPDHNRSFHSHPWYANSIILDGAYLEESATLNENGKIIDTKLTMYRRGDLNVINPNTIHRIIECAPNTWSMMDVKPHRESWYFIEEDGKVVDMGDKFDMDWQNKYGARDEA